MTNTCKHAHKLREMARTGLLKPHQCRLCHEIADYIESLPQLAETSYAKTLFIGDSECQCCPNCPNQGWYVDANTYTGEPEQVQCEFCYTVENSVFNYIQSQIAERDAENEQLQAKVKERDLRIEELDAENDEQHYREMQFESGFFTECATLLKKYNLKSADFDGGSTLENILSFINALVKELEASSHDNNELVERLSKNLPKEYPIRSTARVFYDVEGAQVNIYTLIRNDTSWAADRIFHLEECLQEAIKALGSHDKGAKELVEIAIEAKDLLWEIDHHCIDGYDIYSEKAQTMGDRLADAVKKIKE